MLWLILFLTLLALIVLDLGVIHRQVREISLYEALAMSAFWISMGLGFAVFVYFVYARHWFGVSEIGGGQALVQYLTAFSLEKMLSLDNLFVMALIFHRLQVPVAYQHRVLFWGILTAAVSRGVFIFTGMFLLQNFSWMSYVFGAVLLFSAFKVLGNQTVNSRLDENMLLRAIRKIVPIHNEIADHRFFRRSANGLALTPLFLALLLVESADVMFALDSIPAVLAVSREPFIVYSSNIFAVLGLRALYFVLASALQQFHYLRLGMVLILIFIGIKMLLMNIYPISAMVSLLIISMIMLAGIFASLLDRTRGDILATSPLAEDLGRLYTVTFAGVKRIAILLIGTSVVIVGIIMIFTPGPAVVVIPAGLAILATEFLWARRLLNYFKHKLVYYSKETRGYLRRQKSRQPDNDKKD